MNSARVPSPGDRPGEVRRPAPAARLLPAALAATILLAVIPAATAATAPVPASRPNVLFIAVDDLNHWVGHLGRNPQARTPNLDRLAQQGTTFTRAYCAAPACNPSRAALMSGLRPATTGIYHNPDDWRPGIPVDRMLTTQFRQAGYWVGGVGKIYHGGFDRPEEWDAYAHPGDARNLKRHPSAPDDGVAGIRFAPLDCADEDLADHRIASWGIEQLGQDHGKPFFLAIGFHKPHMPWNVPKKYFDQFPLAKVQLPPQRTNDLADVPEAGVRMAHANDDHAKILASGRWKEAVQGYLAAIAFLDVQVGRVLDALEKSPQRTNTIVCLWGDHGWHLGEKEHWRKFALWEEATRAPLVWVVPGLTTPGTRCGRTVDFLSIYPTLCDLAGLPVPAHVEGPSLRPLLENPKAPWTRPALTTHGFRNHAVRSEQYRLIRYADGSTELYDHQSDPFEWTNLAGQPESAAALRDLSRHLPSTDHAPVNPASKAQPD